MSQDNYEELDKLIGQVIDGSLTAKESERLTAILVNSPNAIQRYAETLDTHTALCEIYPSFFAEQLAHEEEVSACLSFDNESRSSSSPGVDRHRAPVFELAAGLVAVFLVGFVGYLLGQGDHATHAEKIVCTSPTPAGSDPIPRKDSEPASDSNHVFDFSRETTLVGHGILRQAIDVAWPTNQRRLCEGSLLKPGNFYFDSGVVIIDFFSGATLVVEGPAHLDIESDWAVTVLEGKLEATVPPAAKGFVIKAADTEIIDLGTQFALEISANKARVAVLDGEVMLRGDRFANSHLLTGEQANISTHPAMPFEENFLSSIPRLAEIADRKKTTSKKRHREYQQFIDRLATNPQLIGLFAPQRSISNRLLPNIATAARSSDAQIIGPVEIVPGRFASETVGLGFRRPGSRARMKLDGTFSAYTFSCWAKIDSLAHRYNALFLADGYENGEPHWQIRHDGRLMFSVMVDEDRELVYPTGPETPPIQDAGFHHVYFSQPIWNKSLAGTWLHLVAVYDPASRKVIQYVDGKEVARETIADDFFISDLHIGAAEIGNWGQPFRATPDFAVRNLDGVIDEMLIASEPLSQKEIVDLYQQGKPE